MRKHAWLTTGLLAVAVGLVPGALAAEVRKDAAETKPAVKDEPRGETRREARREGEVRPDAPREGEVRREPRAEGEVRREGRADSEVRREGRGEGEARGLPREIAQMLEELKPTDEQKKAIQEKVAAKEAALADWRKSNEAKLREAEAALRALMDEQRKVAEAADANILAAFTPEQLARWETLKIARLYDRRGENPLILTEAQLAKMKTVCEAAVKQLVALATSQPANVQAKQEILYQLQRKIYYEVLEEQDRPAAPNPDRGRVRPRGAEGEKKDGEGRR